MRVLLGKIKCFKRFSFGTNARTETFAPLICCVINHALLQATHQT